MPRNWKVDLCEAPAKPGGIIHPVEGFKERSYATRQAAERAAGALAIQWAGAHHVRLREAGGWIDAIIAGIGDGGVVVSGRYSHDLAEGAAAAARGA